MALTQLAILYLWTQHLISLRIIILRDFLVGGLPMLCFPCPLALLFDLVLPFGPSVAFVQCKQEDLAGFVGFLGRAW